MNARYEPPSVVEFRRATKDDLPIIGELARTIWRACYPSIISREQIEYMLAQRYTEEALAGAVAAGKLTFELLLADGAPIGFAGHSPGDKPDELKLHQLYILPVWHGRGLGGRLIRHIESLARASAKGLIVLTVNRRNTRAIAAYERSGFVVRAVVDTPIGEGFVMEDFVMTKRLAPAAS